MKNLTKNIILILGALFIFTMPSYSLDLKNSPEDCTFIINNVNNEQTKELAYFYRGQYYYENGEYSKAVSDFTESIKRAKTNDSLEESYFSRGIAYFDMENFEKAIPDFTEAINRATNNPASQAESYMYRGRSYLMLGNHNLAIKDSTTVIQKGYADKESWAFPAYYTRGMAYDELKNYKSAIADLTKFINYEKNNLQDPLVVLQVGDAYRTIALAKIEAGMVKSHNDALAVFKDLEKAISTYSALNSPIANAKKEMATTILKELKARYYR